MQIDEYLQSGSSLERLKQEYVKYGSLVVAFDFDNTVYDFHKKGSTYNNVIELLRKLKEKNCFLICWTANENTGVVVEYLVENNIPYDSVNENPPFFKSNAKKIYHNVLLDDRAGLIQVYTELLELLKFIENE